MATSDRALKRAPRPRKRERLPTWAVVAMAALLGLMIYGMLAPKTQSAFDRPEAQVNPSAAPWSQPHAY